MNRLRAMLAAAGLLWAALAVGQPAAKPDAAKGESIAKQVCAACHAPDGNSTLPDNPKLAGQFERYLHKQLVDFKAQGGKKAARESAIMAGMVANLSDADMRAVAAYYAQQTLRPAAATDKDRAALGQKLWRGGVAEKPVRPVCGVRGSAAQGIPVGCARQRRQRHDAGRGRAHERRGDQGGRRVRCGAALGGAK